jgi:uncharacterized protein YjbJ (UPF0337 family)
MNNDTLNGGLRQGLGAAESRIGQIGDNVEMRLRGQADVFLGKVQEAYGQAKDTAVETFDGVDAFVTERPYLTAALVAGFALAIGFVIGLGQPKVIVIKPAAGPRA